MKFLKYTILVLGCIIWACGLNPTLLALVGKYKLITDGYQYGDLYRMANLSAFKDPRKECPDYTPPARKDSSRKVHLYIVGDSFTEDQRVGKSDFAVDRYQYVKWSDMLHVKLDTSATNILLLESVERHFRQHLATPVTSIIPDSTTFVQRVTTTKFMHKLDEAFNGKQAQDRFEALLFQNEAFLKVKEWKADFTYHLFHRINTSVTLVDNDRSVVSYMDTDTPHVTSSFSKIRESELDSLVMNLQITEDSALAMGFDLVALSIIPNKVSVLQPEYDVYNQLIERAYQHPKLPVPYIDVLSDFRNMGTASYLKGDSHWTCEAQNLWLNKVNTLINSFVDQENI
ncbi:hypothetical protein [Dyadobacter fanqingshengii]|uniref:AlgX/AlgJ SGNH hydrolase-like domain-containing protein n=1 Tax=Dyadobacter fanqingshengii TaxID=2906443 RepID=A0A9X1TFJ9_9BACT|nr:hypothetical protein [Dyadobacter fanqingshengii]MCF0039577.1 hypothetical protein [Dyadobacter fanqingshengii]USJ38653.1 hypothetical protein NFI81_12935 [Dyadobacter fanqingshengii]